MCSTCYINPLVTLYHNTPVRKEEELTFGWGERPIQISGQVDIYHTRATTHEILHLKNTERKPFLHFCVFWVNLLSLAQRLETRGNSYPRRAQCIQLCDWMILSIKKVSGEVGYEKFAWTLGNLTQLESISTKVNQSYHFNAIKPDHFSYWLKAGWGFTVYFTDWHPEAAQYNPCWG